MNHQYSLAELEAMPTLSVSQADSLKIDKPGNYRVWLSRCGVGDGEPYPNKVTVERWVCDKWTEERTYRAR
jgi:hypothetical protein